ncbi:MAG: nitrate reductase subunit beta [Calditrichia bacterium]
MNVRAQVSMVFHLDKCIGCHTCSIACKNIWTDRKGSEYMWWNNVETKPGTGYPTFWEDQEKFKGGWVVKKGKLKLKMQNRPTGLANLFFNPYLPSLDDYYEPFTFQYEELFNAPAGEDQPTARAISMVTGKPIDIKSGPNWDDDLSGSPLYAENDLNLANISEEERRQLFELQRMVYFYLPRICNHCLNPGCVGACPAGAIYKRGEDGIVLVSQEKCRGWRMCISGCPYKKVYYNWGTGKSEKCILCFPRLETGQAPACFHSCVGRIRYLGVLLYDADRIEEIAKAAPEKLVQLQREIILNPTDPSVVEHARSNNIHDAMIQAAQQSPVYRFVKEWELALPLHPEFRTLPMLFYVPPLLPVMGNQHNETYQSAQDFFSSLENARIPIQYLAALFSAGNTQVVAQAYKKLIAVRLFKRAQSVGDISEEEIKKALNAGNTSPEEAEAIYQLTSLSTFKERFVIPPMAREMAIESWEDPLSRKNEAGVGLRQPAKRRW